MEFIIDAEVFNPHDKYLKIMDMISSPDLDVSKNTDFQKLYSGYYITAPIDNSFRKFYFEYMQKCRNAVLSFRKIMETLYDESGAVHYSFSSKLLHTLAPENPVLDKHIMRLMGFYIMDSAIAPEDRIEYYCGAFDAISSEYQRYKDEPFMQEALAAFDKAAPEDAFKNIAYTKKVDMLLFRLRNNRSASLLDYLFITH